MRKYSLWEKVIQNSRSLNDVYTSKFALLLWKLCGLSHVLENPKGYFWWKFDDNRRSNFLKVIWQNNLLISNLMKNHPRASILALLIRFLSICWYVVNDFATFPAPSIIYFCTNIFLSSGDHKTSNFNLDFVYDHFNRLTTRPPPYQDLIPAQ